MNSLPKRLAVAFASLMLLLAAAAAFAGCGEGATTPPAETQATTLPAGGVVDRALLVLGSTVPTGDFPHSSISGVKLASMLASNEERSKLFLLDTRNKEDFDKGHIEGSMQVGFQSWAAPENLARYPRDKKIIVIDYLDDYGGQVGGGLRMLGYDTAILRGGINGWAQGFLQAQISAELADTDYPVDTTPGDPFLPAPTGVVFGPPSAADFEVLAGKANSLFGGQQPGAYNTITAAELNRLVQTEDAAGYFILDIRPRVDFNQGHIKGAVNIPFPALGVRENLERVPRDKKIVVVCAFASSSGQVAAILKMLGYDAVLLKHSMMSWNGFGKNTFLEYIRNAGNPVVASP